MDSSKQSLNATQLEILKLFAYPLNEKDLSELKELLVDYLSKKMLSKIEAETEKRGYTQKDFDNWLNDPNQ